MYAVREGARGAFGCARVCEGVRNVKDVWRGRRRREGS